VPDDDERTRRRARAAQLAAAELHLQLGVCQDRAAAIASRLVDLIAEKLDPKET
jgi:hypothetical protein